jgi:hypothetical protein
MMVITIKLEPKKFNKKLMVETITQKIKGKGKERPKDAQSTRTKEGRELIVFVVGIYFTHNLFNVACMQIVRSNSNKRYKTNISCQHNLFLKHAE